MPNLLRVSVLSLGGILLLISPFSAVAQSCNRYNPAPAYAPAYPTYAAPYSGYSGYSGYYDYNAPSYTVPGYGAYTGGYGYYSSPDWYGRHEWREHREHEWREHREHEWREHEGREHGGWYR